MLDHNQIIFPRLSNLVMHFPERGERSPVRGTHMEGWLWRGPGRCLSSIGTKRRMDRYTPPKLDATGSTLLHRKDEKFIIYRGSHASASSLYPRVAMREYYEHVKQPKVNESHMESFVQACMGNGKTTSPFSISGELTQLLHLGVTCQYLNESFEFDRKTKRIRGNDRAQAVLDGPEPRAGWREYYQPVSTSKAPKRLYFHRRRRRLR